MRIGPIIPGRWVFPFSLVLIFIGGCQTSTPTSSEAKVREFYGAEGEQPVTLDFVERVFGKARTRFDFRLDDANYSYQTYFPLKKSPPGLLFKDRVLIATVDASVVDFTHCTMPDENRSFEICLKQFKHNVQSPSREMTDGRESSKEIMLALGIGGSFVTPMAAIILPTALAWELSRVRKKAQFKHKPGDQLSSSDPILNESGLVKIENENGQSYVLTSIGRPVVAFGVADEKVVWVSHHPEYLDCNEQSCGFKAGDSDNRAGK